MLLRRLTGFLVVALSLVIAGTSALGNWFGQASEDLLTGNKKLLLYTAAVTTDYTHEGNPLLTIFVDPEGGLEIYVDWRANVGTKQHPVRYRFDNGPIHADVWIPSLSGKSSFCPDRLSTGESKLDFLEKLKSAQFLTIRVTTEEGRTLTARFSVAGLQEKMRELETGVNLFWRYKVGDGIISSPAVDADGNVFFGSHDGYVYALSGSGRLLWRVKTGGRVISSPAISRTYNAVYVGSEDGSLYCIDKSTGTVRWKFKTEAAIVSDPAISEDENVVFIGNNAGVVFAINRNGALVWRQATKRDVRGGPVIGRNGTVYVANWEGVVYGFSPKDGKILASYNVGDRISATPAIDEAGNVYVVSRNGKLVALSPDLRALWERELGAEVIASPVIGPNRRLYVGTMRGELFALDLRNSLLWTFKAADAIYGTPLVDSSGTVYFPSRDGNLYAMSPEGYLLWSYKADGPILSSPTLTPNGLLLFGSNDAYLYCLRTPASGLAESAWPKFRKNLLNTGRLN